MRVGGASNKEGEVIHKKAESTKFEKNLSKLQKAINTFLAIEVG